jgi:GMP synthase-like glutamine amidotransferase
VSEAILVLKHVACEGAGSWESYCVEQRRPLHVAELWRGDTVLRPDDYAAILVMGGPMSVHDEDQYPFLRYEKQFLRDAMAKRVPVLGVCLGAQLLANSRGAAVRPNRVREIGFAPIAINGAGSEDPLFAGLGDQVEVFHWHGETFDTPAGGVHLASSALCTHQAFRAGPWAWGLQFHVEIIPAMVAEWLGQYAGELASCGQPAPGDWLIRQSREKAAALQSVARRLFDNFCRACGLNGAVRPRPVLAASV